MPYLPDFLNCFWKYEFNEMLIFFYLGPETWPDCYPDAGGQRQSPIDINPVDLKTLNFNRRLEWKYVPENTQDITNPGYCWKVHVKGDGSGNNYSLILAFKHLLQSFE